MRFYKHLYLSDSSKKYITKIKSDLRHHRVRFGTYVLLLRDTEDAKIEMFHNAFLSLKPMDSMDYTVIGIAESEREGLELFGLIMKDVYRIDTSLLISAETCIRKELI